MFFIAPFLTCLFLSASVVCDDIPELNARIVAFVKTKANKKVGRGECWDLAAEALNGSGAKWDGNYGFGKSVDPNKDCIYPGDILQFDGVEIDYREKNTVYHQDLEKHTAIIFQVKSKGNFVVAEQNTSEHGRVVSFDPLDLKNVSKGAVKVFRPVK